MAAAAERAAAGGRKPARRFRDCPSWCPVLEGPALLFVESQNLARTARPGLRFSVAARRLRALGACSAVFRHLLLNRHAPAAKQQGQLKAFVDKLAKGDEVVVSNGLLGKVDKVLGDIVFVEVANSLKLRVLKNAVTQPPAYKASEEKEALEPKK